MHRLFCRAAWLTGWLLLGTARAWVPGTSSPDAADGFTVNRANRRDVLAYYHSVYAASEGYAGRIGWTGSLATGAPGATSAAFREDVRRRINFYRALAGLPADIIFSSVKNGKCQEAALLSARNNALSHDPPPSWTFYTANADEAANNSNLTLGYYGPGAIDAYVRDDGANNHLVGHRRWLFYSRAREMGSGDLPPVSPYSPSNATWVIGDPKPAPAAAFVAWPGNGYFPLPLLPARWSLSYPGANFASATVTMTRAGAPVGVTVISRTDNGYADNTLVWQPADLPATAPTDLAYVVTVAGITGGGAPASFTYTVTLFDPDRLGDEVSLAGASTPPTTGATYTFNTINQADQYEASVTTVSATPWAEGAEASPAPRVLSQVSPGLVLMQTAVKRTGARAFQLTFPNFDQEGQAFQIDREIVPSAASSLLFYDLFRFVTATSRLSAELSENGGVTWVELWGRNGNGSGSSLNWDPSFLARSVSLAAWAGKPVRLRFIFRHNDGSSFIGTSSSYGVFIDDVSVSASTEWVSPTQTVLGSSATGWTFNAASAGGTLLPGVTYNLRMRANVGRKWFPYGPTLSVISRAPTGYETWAATRYPTLTGAPSDDTDGDGQSNAFEYAFDTSPLTANLQPPQTRPNFTAGGYGVTFTPPPGLSGVTYTAEWSPDLATWFPISNTGAGGPFNFRTQPGAATRRFFRLAVTLQP